MSKKFGLGKGLADIKADMGIIPNISVLTGVERVVVKQIPLIEITPDLNQPRKNFNEDDLKDLSRSIKEKGVLQPILLRSINDPKFKYIIIAGERRFRASKLAGLTEIPALIKNIDEKNSIEIALIENVQRENLTPIEESEAYKNLINNFNYSYQDLSKLIGKSESYIRNLLRIDTLPDSVKQLINDKKITLSHARTIVVSKNPEELANKIINENLNVSELESIVKKTKRSKNSRNFTSNLIDEEIKKEIKKEIKNNFDLQVEIHERKGGAIKLVLNIPNRIKLNEFINKLKNS